MSRLERQRTTVGPSRLSKDPHNPRPHRLELLGDELTSVRTSLEFGASWQKPKTLGIRWDERLLPHAAQRGARAAEEGYGCSRDRDRAYLVLRPRSL